MIQQIIMAGDGFIDPTVPVGGIMLSSAFTGTYPGDGSFQLRLDETYTIPTNWRTKTYTYDGSATSIADYVTFGFSGSVFLNGDTVFSWNQDASNSGYFRNNSGTLTATYTFAAKAGDIIRLQFFGRGRDVGGTTPVSTITQQLKRAT